MSTITAEKKIRVIRMPTAIIKPTHPAPGAKPYVDKNPVEAVETGWQKMKGKSAAEKMQQVSPGKYYEDMWRLIQKLGLEDKEINVHFSDDGILDTIKDENGRELIGGKFKETPVAGEKDEGYQAGGVVGGNPIGDSENSMVQASNGEAEKQTSFAIGGEVGNVGKSKGTAKGENKGPQDKPGSQSISVNKKKFRISKNFGFPTEKLKKYPTELPKGKEKGQEGHALPSGKHGSVPKIKVTNRVKKGFENGGLVSNKKMTGAQILKEFGVKQPGDDATVYDVVAEDGKLKSATPDKQESQRFSRVVDQMGTDKTGIGTGYERNQAALQYENKPNVGVASGAGFAEGGPVEPQPANNVPSGESATPPVPEQNGAEVKPAPAGTPSEGGDMNGPFESYAKADGVDEQLVRKGNTLFTELDNAVTNGDTDQANRFIDELRQFVNDVESAKTDAVNKANDTSLAATYKEMANDARDLLSAFENMIADKKSPEAEAATETPVPEQQEVG